MPHRNRTTFAVKVFAAVALVALGDFVFDGETPGAVLGVFALAWVAALARTRAATRRGGARIALLSASGFALVLLDDPGRLAWGLFWCATALAALLPRHRFDDAFVWAQRLTIHAVVGIGQPVGDLARSLCARRARRGDTRARGLAGMLALPVVWGALFLALFASANPLIANAFAALAFPDAWTIAGHGVLWTFLSVTIWSSLRPHRWATAPRNALRTPGVRDVPLATLTLSLVTFNAIFAIQNALDIIFLWSGAPLPGDVTMADYAHRGAYALIVTALLAAAFVLVALRPGSAGARSPLARRLVIAWIAQNLLLVASSILRTLDYVAAYSLTVLRIAALAWMALVAVGLALIAWRLVRERSAAWLVNANALAATIVLATAAIVDPGAIAAAWNVAHAREAGGDGAAVDLCYIVSLDDSALVSLAKLDVRDPVLRDRVAWLRGRATRELAAEQADWRRWTWRGARRLATVTALPAPASPRPAPHGRGCGGEIVAPPAAPPAARARACPVDAGRGTMILCPMPRTILVVDDDPHIRQLLVFALDKAGLGAIEAADGEAALASAAAHGPDLVILDINMPRMDGLEACRRLRQAGDVPILFLSSRDDEIDRVLGIELGADDYVVKPFSPREVVARVMAILRRTAAHPPSALRGDGIAHGHLRLDLDGWRALWRDGEVALTVTEFSILRLLASMPAKVFTRDAIIDRLHGPGFAVTDRTIDSHIRNLRAKFAGVGAADLIETRAGIGYRLGACSGT